MAKEYIKYGIDLRNGRVPDKVEKREDGLYTHLAAKDDMPEEWLGPFEKVLYAIGRVPSA